MKFEDTIKKISGFVAGLLIFFIGAGMYLNLKGFIMSPVSYTHLTLPTNSRV